MVDLANQSRSQPFMNRLNEFNNKLPNMAIASTTKSTEARRKSSIFAKEKAVHLISNDEPTVFFISYNKSILFSICYYHFDLYSLS